MKLIIKKQLVNVTEKPQSVNCSVSETHQKSYSFSSECEEALTLQTPSIKRTSPFRKLQLFTQNMSKSVDLFVIVHLSHTWACILLVALMISLSSICLCCLSHCCCPHSNISWTSSQPTVNNKNKWLHQKRNTAVFKGCINKKQIEMILTILATSSWDISCLLTVLCSTLSFVRNSYLSGELLDFFWSFSARWCHCRIGGGRWNSTP